MKAFFGPGRLSYGGTLRVPMEIGHSPRDRRLAAEEIQEHVEKISGAGLEIVQAGEPLKGRLPVRIGSAADSALDAEIRTRGEAPGAFALIVGTDGVSVRGLSPFGTLIGAYELLKQIGVRWFMPGDLGLVVPQTGTVRIEKQRTIQVPSFAARLLPV